MTLVRSFSTVAATAVPVAWKSLARVEKIRLSNAPDGERRDAQQQEEFATARLARARLSRDETTGVVPEQDERRLVSTFVAQVLAQVMPGHSADARSALFAYRNGAAQIAPVYDRDL
ncbi:MAG TPA: hypothetical protein VLT91_15080 [Rhizomicrobium sp.]|nr:hypothetical protein [Rhizomicrobium sp.]